MHNISPNLTLVSILWSIICHGTFGNYYFKCSANARILDSFYLIILARYSACKLTLNAFFHQFEKLEKETKGTIHNALLWEFIYLSVPPSVRPISFNIVIKEEKWEHPCPMDTFLVFFRMPLIASLWTYIVYYVI